MNSAKNCGHCGWGHVTNAAQHNANRWHQKQRKNVWLEDTMGGNVTIIWRATTRTTKGAETNDCCQQKLNVI